ncbi:MAG: type III secretion inner membrane ring lipoprotein SctJ [Kiritimatiellae bacterium]|nr:type III secretion inner membrane ring lipoprotein SctJ [Kiritimatiellia bacterium]
MRKRWYHVGFQMGIVWFCGLGLLTGGCESNSVLFAALEERQANVVLATLLDAGIPARKEAASEEAWRVMIPERDFATATLLLEQRGLPERQYRGVGEVFRKTGMVSSPSEERIRFMDALSQDLAKTLSGIEGVVDARVHVVLPENDPFAKQTLPSSAAVAIRHQWDADVTDLVPQVKGLVKHAIEGLDYDKISVTLFRDAPPPIVELPPVPHSPHVHLGLTSLLTILGTAFGCCVLGGIFLWRHLRKIASPQPKHVG